MFSASAQTPDCLDARTQIDMNQCAHAALERETTALNRSCEAIRAKLDPARQQQFRAVQRAWVRFKDLSCKFEASGVEGGSAHPMILSGCLAEKTRLRNKELDALAHCQEGDLSCPVW